LVWGSSDFSGGLASRRQDAYRVLLLASISGLVALVAFMLIFGEKFGTPADIAWSAAAGAFGALGIVMLYTGLALSGAALVAPTAAVVGALLPVIVGIATEGLPAVTRMVGFVLGVFGIWLTSASSADDSASSRTGLGYAVAAGLGFGGFFILISRVGSGAVFAPLVIARSVAVLVALFILLVRRMPLPALTSNPLANLAGGIDAVGNVFYLLAARYTRLDIAVILSSMYPAVTVLLSSRVLHERISPLQWLGVGLCVLAVVLIVV
jgi:drug/metabolite transporter (DMT)-like permease